MTTVFTICSLNYLAQAKVLGESLLRNNPDYFFSIFLVDRIEGRVNRNFLKPIEIVPVEEIGIAAFPEMCERYDITELNTAVKPFIFNYLFSTRQNVDRIIYLDPDIYVYRRFDALNAALGEYNIVITPHFFTPIFDRLMLSEPSILNAGLYNLGFLAVRRSEVTSEFLNWWMIKLTDQCFVDFKNGLFVDQLWINLVPLYYDKVLIFRDRGYNVAYWNLHERQISGQEESYFVNEAEPLVFFHFSGYLFDKPEFLSKYQTRYTFEQKPDVVPLFKKYFSQVKENGFDDYSKYECYYIGVKKAKQLAEERSKRRSIRRMKQRVAGFIIRKLQG